MFATSKVFVLSFEPNRSILARSVRTSPDVGKCRQLLERALLDGGTCKRGGLLWDNVVNSFQNTNGFAISFSYKCSVKKNRISHKSDQFSQQRHKYLASFRW